MGTDLVFNQNGKLLTSSLLVAKTFGKSHDKVLRNIREMSCSEGFRAANFGDTSYIDAQGKTQPDVEKCDEWDDVAKRDTTDSIRKIMSTAENSAVSIMVFKYPKFWGFKKGYGRLICQ